jgi:hypothetical protein
MPSDNLVAGPYLGSTRNPYSYQKVEQVDRDISTAWLTLEEITQQLNLDGDESQDSYLTSLELATRMAIEDYLGLTILPVTYKVYYGATNNTGTQMTLDLPEVSQDTPSSVGVTVDSVGYWNASSTPVFIVLDPTEYYYDPTGNKIVLNSGMPSEVNTVMTNPIVAEYTTAPSIISQYPVIKQAGLLLLTHLYNNRSNSSNVYLHDIPFGVTALLRTYKPLVL